MRTKLLLSADTPCDIGAELQKRYDVQLFPLHIQLGSKTYTDGLDINNEALYDAWRKERLLPKTAAINPEEYINYFRPFIEDGFEILHISLGSGLSCCYQNAVIAASELGHVRVIDSRNLSSGFGHLVCEAGERINAGYSLDQIVGEVEALVPKVSASFVLDTLEFMHAGGRCSNFAQLGATLMRLKPSIEVLQSQCGGMVVGRKYIGKLDSALKKYVSDQLKDRTDIVLDRAFITHTCPDRALPEEIAELVLKLQSFRELHITRASCTIGSHCGPNTLGVLFLRK